MLEAFWIPILPPIILGLVASWLLELLLKPRPEWPSSRSLSANLTHIGVWLLVFALELALFRRPYFAVANVLAIQLILILVSRAKYDALHEPFVFPDFEYFSDAVKHPRLYLPFFGWRNVLVSGGGYGIALWLGMAFEDSVTAGAGVWLVSFADLPQESPFDPTAPLAAFYTYIAIMACGGIALAYLAGNNLTADFDAGQDLKRLGFIASLWAYAREERQSVGLIQDEFPFHDQQMTVAASVLPDLVTVQSESFFDVRAAYGLVKRDVLSAYDKICTEALAFGDLDVAARGANTVRTEFAFLSGVGGQKLGIHRYNPYRRLAGQGVPTMASYLRQLGYRTICVHPFYGSFYRRDKVIPALGFDEFVDLGAFGDADRVGAYVGDEALGNYVRNLLREKSDQPLYVHVITMENHGPLHWESVTTDDVEDVIEGVLPEGCADLVAYARHLKNADRMFASLHEEMQQSARPCGLCIFGDHVPIMRGVYSQLGDVPGTSNFVIWSNKRNRRTSPTRVAVSELGNEFLSHLGVKGRSISRKSSGLGLNRR